jgi:hypothetical protein
MNELPLQMPPSLLSLIPFPKGIQLTSQSCVETLANALT